MISEIRPEALGAGAASARPAVNPSIALAVAGAAGCVALLLVKLALLRRLNINWDEFYFLTHVHELRRGELTLFFQGAYTHLFTWLGLLGANEIGQILAARGVMLALLAATVVLIWRLASTWTHRWIALIAPVSYLSMLPVMKHGASFRYDSLIAPLTMLVLVLLARIGPREDRRKLGLAAACLGVAAAITPKAVFVAPVAAGILLLGERPFRRKAFDVVVFGALSIAVAAVLMLLHRLALATPPEAAQVASSSLGKAILDAPFFPQAGSYYETRYADRLAWPLLFGGAIVAALSARYRPGAACILALAPILFYRNAFPYYYVVMLAPAAVLIAVCADFAYRWIAQRSHEWTADALACAIVVAFSAQGLVHAYSNRHDGQRAQRAVIEAVHRIFPEPAPYVDHSGMIASFTKVNFFMSTWGIEEYRKRGRSFIEPALFGARAPLLIANRPVLDPDAGQFVWLLPRDRELIEKHYLPYWGPIRVAGAAFELTAQTSSAVIQAPFAADYRLESSQPVLIDGVPREPGDVLRLGSGSVTVSAIDGASREEDVTGRLVIASAQSAPKSDPPLGGLYTGL